jgi:CheY-like chemotaxis protein
MIEDVTLTVLVVDDDPAFRGLASRILAELGFETIGEAGDTASAMTEAELMRPEAVLVDVGLPDGDGVELARALMALPWRPRVLLTSSDRDAISAVISDDGTSLIPFMAKEDIASKALGPLLARE